MRKSKLNKREKPKVNPELDGFDIQIDTFGEIKTNYDIEKINEFLNRHVDDKKLKDREDIDPVKKDNSAGEEATDNK